MNLQVIQREQPIKVGDLERVDSKKEAIGKKIGLSKKERPKTNEPVPIFNKANLSRAIQWIHTVAGREKEISDDVRRNREGYRWG
jgi:hypothetical protein